MTQSFALLTTGTWASLFPCLLNVVHFPCDILVAMSQVLREKERSVDLCAGSLVTLSSHLLLNQLGAQEPTSLADAEVKKQKIKLSLWWEPAKCFYMIFFSIALAIVSLVPPALLNEQTQFVSRSFFKQKCFDCQHISDSFIFCGQHWEMLAPQMNLDSIPWIGEFSSELSAHSKGGGGTSLFKTVQMSKL